MTYEYLILGAIVGWAVFYLWRTFFRKGGCNCGSCPSADSRGCVTLSAADAGAGATNCKANGQGNAATPDHPAARPASAEDKVPSNDQKP